MNFRFIKLICFFIILSFTNVFAQIYTISASADPIEGGNITGLNVGGLYNNGESVDINANPAVGYTFENWTEGGIEVSTDENYNFTASADRVLVANFIINSYTVTIISNPLEGGTLSGGGDYNHGATATLEATPNLGYTFTGWSGDLTGTTNPIDITVESIKNITANFNLNSYLVTTAANPVGGGTVTGGGSYSHGTVATLAATPNPGYTFTGWSGDLTGASNPENITVDSDKNITANFALNKYTLTASVLPIEAGTITGIKPGGLYDHGENVNITAAPNVGYTFVNWTSNGNEISTLQNLVFNINSDTNLVANFLINSYTLTTIANPDSGGITVGDGTFAHGTSVNIIGTPKEGWRFFNWKSELKIISTDSSYLFPITSDTTFTASFRKKVYSISTTAIPLIGGITSGGGNYQHGKEVTIIATPNIGWNFISWKENDDDVFIDSLVTFIANNNRELEAHFEKKTYSITTSIFPEDGGTTEGDSVYTHGDLVELKAIANSDSGYEFESWTENDVVVSIEPIYSFTATEVRNLVAKFKLRKYSVFLTPTSNDSGSTNGGGIYTHGDGVTITATPGAGWLFANWVEDSVNVSSESVYTFIIKKSRNIHANFAHELYNVISVPQPIEAGRVSGAGSFFYGQEAILIATPNEGWEFNKWTINGSTVAENETYRFSVAGNVEVLAIFTEANYLINCSALPNGSGFTSGCGVARFNQTIKVTAIPNNGYKFIRWTENNVEVSTEINYEFIVKGNRDLVAHFDLVNSVERLDGLNAIPDKYYLSNAYPNPFNPSTKIEFGLPEQSEISISVFNVNGQLVNKIYDGVTLAAGNYLSTFDAFEVPSGVYFYVISAKSINSDKNFRKVSKLLLIK